MKALRRPADFIQELYFTPEAVEALPSRSYFGEEPEFQEELERAFSARANKSVSAAGAIH